MSLTKVYLYPLMMLLFLFFQSVQAQNIQTLPGASVGNPQLPHPGTVHPNTLPFPPLPNQLNSTPSVISPPSATVRPSSSAQLIMIQQIQVQGVQNVDIQDIKDITTPFEGHSSTLNELQEGVIEAITRLYEKKGYITTVVFIPPQKLEDGNLTIQVEEGAVSEVEYEGGKLFKDIAVEPRINLKPGQILNIKNLQCSIHRINENPDLQVQAILKAGTEPGSTRVIIRPVEERFFMHVMPSVDNLGRPTIGNFRGGVTVTNNNVLGLADTGYGNVSWTRKSWGNVSGYEVPIPWKWSGTKAGLSCAYNHFNFNQSNLNFKGSATLYTPYITHELWRTERSTLTSELGFGFKNASLQVEGFDVSEDRIRTLTPALSYISYDRWGRTVMRHEMGIGLDLLNATLGSSSTTSRPGAGSQFWRYTTYIVRTQQLPWHTYSVFKLLGQVTPNKLVSLEQFQIGGSSTVRGYQQGLLIGDSGWVGSVEWRIPLRFLPLPKDVKLFRTHYNLRDAIEWVAFSDIGGVYANGSRSSVNPKSNSLVNKAVLGSVGTGLRIKLTRFIAARLDLGIPYLRVDGNKTAAWFHFGLESNLF